MWAAESMPEDERWAPISTLTAGVGAETSADPHLRSRGLLPARWLNLLASPVKFLRNLDLASFFKLTTREQFDRITPACMVVLSLFGVFFIYSAQLAREGNHWEKQIFFLILGGS